MRIIIILAFKIFSCSRAGFARESVCTKQCKISEVIDFEKKLDPDAKSLSHNVCFPWIIILLPAAFENPACQNKNIFFAAWL
ncbi:hypothetical protein FFJ24_010805 [Pedobacter sp. KBS0701]|uniref:hypothetical protein n=1 Tax=Pedobacter sp. KBS0701 TaxID=2578106 RepID=UPI0011A2FAF5|nr:hypothetical protein [Pedobacter sp. KBS0701]QDW25271.1 hypothetical protein FFJ24_010805 [Pedobacter sp. KBS0701]